ncbi:hypothetical protein SAMN05216302_10529 [Nitrosomonas aestuarii]|uniref:Dockerin domain-containing protein n=1 Tax=Nitrosomonas aestuarii TaxID=52441 RepID=A0A1I4GCW0_9PROT|nr:dockerin type I domain-containing protein [Nitrosomonas aestuarii]SFL27875.1 hypothetical protein SAMN05216302_10529 [Nitrosomonas aestuarii]
MKDSLDKMFFAVIFGLVISSLVIPVHAGITIIGIERTVFHKGEFSSPFLTSTGAESDKTWNEFETETVSGSFNKELQEDADGFDPGASKVRHFLRTIVQQDSTTEKASESIFSGKGFARIDIIVDANVSPTIEATTRSRAVITFSIDTLVNYSLAGSLRAEATVEGSDNLFTYRFASEVKLSSIETGNVFNEFVSAGQKEIKSNGLLQPGKTYRFEVITEGESSAYVADGSRNTIVGITEFDLEFKVIPKQGNVDSALSFVLEPIAGDINDDGVVDRNDLIMLLKERGNTVDSSDCGAVCDLDGDGLITIHDARKLVLLCTWAQCMP